MLLLGLAFLLGQQKQLKGILLLPFSVLAGLLINHYSLLSWNTELILLVLALICGLLLVLRLSLSKFITIMLLVFCGIIVGLDSSPVMIPGLGTNSIISWQLGATLTINIGIVLLSLFAYLLNQYWNGIILRVAGSWIATSAIFVLTLMLAGKS